MYFFRVSDGVFGVSIELKTFKFLLMKLSRCDTETASVCALISTEVVIRPHYD